MPELPEVITIRNDLRTTIVGKKITAVTALDNYPLKPFKTYFDKHVINYTVTAVNNAAKLIIIELSSTYFIAVHLRMTGNLLFNHKDPYVKISLIFEDGDTLNFSCVRKFGYLEIWNATQLNNYIQKLGKCALESNLDANGFISLLKGRKAPIRNVLLNQKVISGIGNIYANDALYLSKIHPSTPANTLTENNLKILFKNLQKVLTMGIRNRGSSIDRYKDIFGKSGTQQNHFWIYGKKGQVCTQCKSGVIAYTKLQGRGAFYCPICQK